MLVNIWRRGRKCKGLSQIHYCSEFPILSFALFRTNRLEGRPIFLNAFPLPIFSFAFHLPHVSLIIIFLFAVGKKKTYKAQTARLFLSFCLYVYNYILNNKSLPLCLLILFLSFPTNFLFIDLHRLVVEIIPVGRTASLSCSHGQPFRPERCVSTGLNFLRREHMLYVYFPGPFPSHITL